MASTSTKSSDQLPKSSAGRSRNCCPYILFIIGVLLIVFGIFCLVTLEPFVRSMIEEEVMIKKDSPTFKKWTNPPATVLLEMYLMNVTNPVQAAAGLEKPNLVNQGPYVFREIRRKLNVTFHDNGTVSFYEPIFYFWDEERSRGKLTDKITQLDLVVAGMSYKFSQCTSDKSSLADCAIPFLSQNVLPFLKLFDITHELFDVEKRSIFKTYTVDELLFKGYVDPFLKKFENLAKASGEKLPKRIGLMWDRNGSANGVYTIETGANDMERFSYVTRYNGKPKLNVWTTDYANRIVGTIGHGFQPNLPEGGRIEIFAGDLCRSSVLAYNRTVDINGVATYRYMPPADEAVPWPENPKQEGFCYPDTDHCPPDGLMDESACFGEPSFMGKPHFFEADPLLGSVFTGLNPNQQEHETFMHIEPITGAVLDVDKHLMVYFPVRKSFITKYGNINLEPNVRDNMTTIFPVFWVNETAIIPQEIFDDFIYLVYPIVNFAKYSPYVFLFLAFLFMVAAAIQITCCNKSQGSPDDKFESGERMLSSSSSSSGSVKKDFQSDIVICQRQSSRNDNDVINPLLTHNGAKTQAHIFR